MPAGLVAADISPGWCVLVPLCGALAIAIAGRGATAENRLQQNIREAITLATAGTLLWLVCQFWTLAEAGQAPIFDHVEFLPGMPMAFQVEPLGMIYALVASSLWILNSLYSIGYMRGNREKHQTRFYVCFALSIASVMGIAFAANMFTLFVFYEA